MRRQRRREPSRRRGRIPAVPGTHGMERSMKRIFWLGMALTTMLMLPACGSQKHAAETALAQATQAWNAIKAQAENIVPDEAKSIEDAIAAATAQLQGGDNKGALAAATSLASRIKELAD